MADNERNDSRGYAAQSKSALARRPRHILFIAGYYPPYAPAGAVRMPKLVKFWATKGHKVKVIAIENPALMGTLQADGVGLHVSHVPFSQPVSLTWRRRPAAPAKGAPLPEASTDAALATEGAYNSLRDWARKYYHQLVLTPDRYRSWVQPAVDEGMALTSDWRPDVIYSSGPPQSSHIVAARLARALQCPWYAELRDLWIDNPYVELAPPVRLWNNFLAARTLRQATGLVAVTEHAGKQLSRRFRKDVRIAYNGFDPEDFAGLRHPPALDTERLTIVHAGVIYAGRRDPSALFEALARLGDQAAKIRVRFYHDERGFVRSLSERFGVQACVELCSLVPREEILRIQRSADLLLLCRWNNPQDNGVIPGKLFEYVGARRPILAIGSETGEAADIVRCNGFGVVSNNPSVIAEQLARWLDLKRVHGRLPDLDPDLTKGFDRRDQFEKIESFLFGAAAQQPELLDHPGDALRHGEIAGDRQIVDIDHDPLDCQFLERG